MSNQYILTHPEEHERLFVQAQTWESEAEALLDCIQFPPNAQCVDLGCGAMGILGPLSRRAGKDGRVVGVERDPSMLSVAREYVEHERLTNVEFVQADVFSSNLPKRSFDIVHERFVLPYVDPRAMMQEMISFAKPGGVIITQEPDNSPWNFFPLNKRWQKFRDLLVGALNSRGDIDIGQKTFAIAREAGLEDVHVRAAVLALEPGHPYMRMSLMAVNTLRPMMISSGMTTDDELDSLIEEVTRLTSDPNVIQVTPGVIQVWGRKPG